MSQLRPGSGEFVTVLPIEGRSAGKDLLACLTRMALVVDVGPRHGARQVSGRDPAYWAPAQCLRSGDGNTSGLPARTVTGSAHACRGYDTVDLGVGIGPETADIGVPHPTSTAQAEGSSIKLESGTPIGPVDVITVWPNNVLNPASTSTNRPRPPRKSQPDPEPAR